MSLLTLDLELDWSILSDKTPDWHLQNPYQCNHNEQNVQITDNHMVSTNQAFSLHNWIIRCTTRTTEQHTEQSHTTKPESNKIQKQSIQQPLRAEKSQMSTGVMTHQYPIMSFVFSPATLTPSPALITFYNGKASWRQQNYTISMQCAFKKWIQNGKTHFKIKWDKPFEKLIHEYYSLHHPVSNCLTQKIITNWEGQQSS